MPAARAATATVKSVFCWQVKIV